jgi:hypothetical protein
VAVIVTAPPLAGIKVPDDVIEPLAADHVTAELNDPVPCTIAEHPEVVPLPRMSVVGEQVTATEVIEGSTLTVTLVEPYLLESSVEVAVTVAVPTPEGVKTPDEVIVPPVAVHVTAEL